MPLNLQLFTLNCANDGAGKETMNQILADKDPDCDLILLHCQETDFNKIQEEINQALSNHPGWVLQNLGQMVTHTKTMTHFHNHSGLTTLAIRKRDLSITQQPSSPKPARRSNSRFGSGFNKGGLMTRFTVKKDGINYQINSSNGHLDAFSKKKRAQDWANLYRSQLANPQNWEELVAQLPDLVCAGYDANTRNLYQNGIVIKVWENPAQHPELQSLYYAPLGNQRTSLPSTYKPESEADNTPDLHKRPGYTRGGALDMVSYSTAGSHEPNIQESQSHYLPEAGSKRDHVVIGSTLISIETSEYEKKVKSYLSAMLGAALPELLPIIQTLNADQLLQCYQAYLSPGGLMARALSLQIEKLEFWNKQGLETLKVVNVKQQLEKAIFHPWFFCQSKEQSLEDNLSNQDFELKLEEAFYHYYQGLKTVHEDEIHLALSILEQSKVALLKANDKAEREAILDQAMRLWAVNHEVNEYKTHLDENQLDKTTSLYGQKLEATKNLLHQLEQKKTPAQIIDSMRALCSTAKEQLSQHRDDRWFTTLIRKLIELLWGKAPSRGEVLVEKIETRLGL